MAKKDKQTGKEAAEKQKTGAAPDGEKENAAAQIDMNALREEVAGILEQRDEYLDRYQRAVADFDNYKKRNAQVRQDVENETKADFALQILPVVDNFERALTSDGGGEEALRKGLDMVYAQLIKVLEEQGVTEISAQAGEVFDPAWHNAVAVVPADAQHAQDTLFDTFQKGYHMGEKVIRYAMVRVAKDA